MPKRNRQQNPGQSTAGMEKSPARKRRESAQRHREDREWVARSGPVTVRRLEDDTPTPAASAPTKQLGAAACSRAALATVLRHRLDGSTLTRRVLAERAGIGLRTLHSYLSGTSDAPLATVVAIAHALDTTLADIAVEVDAQLAEQAPVA